LMTTRTNYPAKFGVMMATGLLAYRRQVHVSGGQNGAAAWNKMLELSSLQGQGGNEFHEFLTNSLHGLHEAFKPLSWCLKHPDFRLRLSEIVKVLDDVCTESSKKKHGFQYLADLANEMLRHVRQQDWPELALNWAPPGVCALMAGIAVPEEAKVGFRVFDPGCGTGQALQAAAIVGNLDAANIYGLATSLDLKVLAHLNLLLAGRKVPAENIHFQRDLADSQYFRYDVGARAFDAVVTMPAFSHSWEGGNSYDLRFKDFKVPGNSSADFVYLLDGLSRLKNDGTLAVCLQSGAAGNDADRENRRRLIEKNLLDAVIQLPTRLRPCSGRGGVVFVCRKDRPADRDILLIDARDMSATHDEVKSSKGCNDLSEADVSAIVSMYRDWQTSPENADPEEMACSVTREDISEQEYDFLPSRYLNQAEGLSLIPGR